MVATNNIWEKTSSSPPPTPGFGREEGGEYDLLESLAISSICADVVCPCISTHYIGTTSTSGIMGEWKVEN